LARDHDFIAKPLRFRKVVTFSSPKTHCVG
jgi:hypothetical protein